MNAGFIAIIFLLAILFGVGGAFLLMLIKKKREQKTILKKIEKQDAKHGKGRTPTNFYKKPEKVPESEKIVAQNGSMKAEKVKETKKEPKKRKKPRKARIKKK